MKINGVHYNVTMSGYGEPLLLLHGFTGSAASWEHLTTRFSSHFRVIAVDLLGHGGTDSPNDPARYGIQRAAADLSAILSASGAEQPHLLGYSMGGRLALSFALRYAVRTLTLESASPGLDDESERARRKISDDELAVQIERDGIPAFVEKWESLPLFATQVNLPHEVRTRLHLQRLANNPIGLANSLRGMGTAVQPSLWSRLSGLDAPTLLISGAIDEKFTVIARDMTKRIRNARHAIIGEAGHTIHLEQPNRFFDEILRFIRDAARRRMA